MTDTDPEERALSRPSRKENGAGDRNRTGNLLITKQQVTFYCYNPILRNTRSKIRYQLDLFSFFVLCIGFILLHGFAMLPLLIRDFQTC